VKAGVFYAGLYRLWEIVSARRVFAAPWHDIA
jgi:hypothetical protein